MISVSKWFNVSYPALRACSVALCLQLALPNPAFALRQPTVEGAGLEELRQTLQDEPSVAPAKHTVRATRTESGLEEPAATPEFLAALALRLGLTSHEARQRLESLWVLRRGLADLTRADRPLAPEGYAVGVEIELAPPWDERVEVRSAPTTAVDMLVQDLRSLNDALATLPPLAPLGYYWSLHPNLSLSAAAADRWTPSLQDAHSPLNQLLFALVAANDPLGRNDYNLERWAKGALHVIKRGAEVTTTPTRADAARLELKDPALGAGVRVEYWRLLLAFLHRVLEQEDAAAVTRHLAAVQAIYAHLHTFSATPAFFLPAPDMSVTAARQQLQRAETLRVVQRRPDGAQQDLGGAYEVDQQILRDALTRYMQTHLGEQGPGLRGTGLTVGLEERDGAITHDIDVVRDAVAAMRALPEAPGWGSRIAAAGVR